MRWCCGCLGGSDKGPSRSSADAKSSWVAPIFLDGSKILERGRNLHHQLSLQIQPTVADRETLLVNLSCVDEHNITAATSIQTVQSYVPIGQSGVRGSESPGGPLGGVLVATAGARRPPGLPTIHASPFASGHHEAIAINEADHPTTGHLHPALLPGAANPSRVFSPVVPAAASVRGGGGGPPGGSGALTPLSGTGKPQGPSSSLEARGSNLTVRPSLVTTLSSMQSSSVSRGFVRLSSVRLQMADPPSLDWTPSRRTLEDLIERENGLAGGEPTGSGAIYPSAGGDSSQRRGGSASTSGGQWVSQEKRLNDRLGRLGLEMVIVSGDGNCQFRSLSLELFGTQDHHALVRSRVMKYIRDKKEDYVPFLGEDFESYHKAMSQAGTWGDELTLRAACDSYGVVVRCVTSEEKNWYISYEPLEKHHARELFLAYISPIHYNALRRQGSLRLLSQQVSRSFNRASGSSQASAAVVQVV